jgi:hypothetical protein
MEPFRECADEPAALNRGADACLSAAEIEFRPSIALTDVSSELTRLSTGFQNIGNFDRPEIQTAAWSQARCIDLVDPLAGGPKRSTQTVWRTIKDGCQLIDTE